MYLVCGSLNVYVFICLKCSRFKMFIIQDGLYSFSLLSLDFSVFFVFLRLNVYNYCYCDFTFLCLMLSLCYDFGNHCWLLVCNSLFVHWIFRFFVSWHHLCYITAYWEQMHLIMLIIFICQRLYNCQRCNISVCRSRCSVKCVQVCQVLQYDSNARIYIDGTWCLACYWSG